MKRIEFPPLLDWQYDVQTHPARFKVAVVGRRSGKSYASKQKCLRIALGGGFTWWISEDYPAAEEHWEELMEMAYAIPGRRISRSGRTLSFRSGGKIGIKSQTSSLRGRGLNHIAVDEGGFYDELQQLWEEVLRPALADHKGSADFTTTPNGYNYLHKLFARGQDDAFPDWMSWQIPTWVANPLIDKAELEKAQHEMAVSSYRQEFGAEFVAQEGRVFPEFSRDLHVRPLQYQPGLQNSIGIDFGLRSFALQFRQIDKRSGTKYVLADRIYREMTTAQALTQAKADFAAWLSAPLIIGVDPAGSARDMQTKRTDVDIVREMFPQARVLYSMQPEHRSPEWRAARMRDMLLSADGTVRVYVDPKATHTIDSYEQSVYPKHKSGQPEKTEPVKDGIVDHMRDADGYGDVAAMHIKGTRVLSGGLY